ncbi:MAG TPA: hypothetical protein DCQ86_03690 [Succinivibrio sp.]|nr:hypothetical protein [Succinivibrio sp.]
MKIKIHNVGKLADATVEIDGITVIAGENDTGKSSVSKALYSVFSSFYHFNKSIYSQRKLEIADLLNSLLGLYTKVVKGFSVEVFKILIFRICKKEGSR